MIKKATSYKNRDKFLSYKDTASTTKLLLDDEDIIETKSAEYPDWDPGHSHLMGCFLSNFDYGKTSSTDKILLSWL